MECGYETRLRCQSFVLLKGQPCSHYIFCGYSCYASHQFICKLSMFQQRHLLHPQVSILVLVFAFHLTSPPGPEA